MAITAAVHPGAKVVMACDACKGVPRVFRVGQYCDVYTAYMVRCDVCKGEGLLDPDKVDEAKRAFREFKEENAVMDVRHKPKEPKLEPPVANSVEATLAQRGSRYGDFSDHARLCQTLMKVMQGFSKDGEVDGVEMENYTPWSATLSDVQRQALTVIADKIARILSGDPDYDDNWHDIQGYAKLAEDRLPKKENK